MEADRANDKATLPHLRYISIDDGIMFTVCGSNGPTCLASGEWASTNMFAFTRCSMLTYPGDSSAKMSVHTVENCKPSFC